MALEQSMLGQGCGIGTERNREGRVKNYLHVPYLLASAAGLMC